MQGVSDRVDALVVMLDASVERSHGGAWDYEMDLICRRMGHVHVTGGASPGGTLETAQKVRLEPESGDTVYMMRLEGASDTDGDPVACCLGALAH